MQYTVPGRGKSTVSEGPTKAAAGSFHATDTTNYTAEDFRFSTKGNVLYAIGLAWPGNREAMIRSLASTAGNASVQSVNLLGSDAKIQFEQRPEGLHVLLPVQPPAKYAYALRIGFGSRARCVHLVLEVEFSDPVKARSR
jgi:alpha-L-fucosidase